MREELHKEGGSAFSGRSGVFLLFGSLLVLSSLLTIITGLYVGLSYWLIAPVSLWCIFMFFLARFNQERLGFWGLVFTFLLYVLALGVLIFVVLPSQSVSGT
ncbi:MAG TPA: hypothetical protein VJ579_02745 [Candidatus Paceibacterota bacterium]|nr:hypothetical protein [Candidatus Paceibacterota bacterium]